MVCTLSLNAMRRTCEKRSGLKSLLYLRARSYSLSRISGLQTGTKSGWWYYVRYRSVLRY